MVSSYSNYKLCNDDCLKPEGCIMPGDSNQTGPGRRQVYPKCKIHKKPVFSWANGSPTVAVKPKYNSEGRKPKNKIEDSQNATLAPRKRDFEDLPSESEREMPVPQIRRRKPNTEAGGIQHSEPVPPCMRLRIEHTVDESQYPQENAPESDFGEHFDEHLEGIRNPEDPLMLNVDDKNGGLQSPEEEEPEPLPVRRSVKEQFEYETSQAFLDDIRMPSVEAALAGWDASREIMELYLDDNAEEREGLVFHLPTPEPYSFSVERWMSSGQSNEDREDFMTLTEYSIDPVIAGVYAERTRRFEDSSRDHLESGQFGPHMQRPVTIMEMDKTVGMVWS